MQSSKGSLPPRPTPSPTAILCSFRGSNPPPPHPPQKMPPAPRVSLTNPYWLIAVILLNMRRQSIFVCDILNTGSCGLGASPIESSIPLHFLPSFPIVCSVSVTLNNSFICLCEYCCTSECTCRYARRIFASLIHYYYYYYSSTYRWHVQLITRLNWWLAYSLTKRSADQNNATNKRKKHKSTMTPISPTYDYALTLKALALRQ